VAIGLGEFTRELSKLDFRQMKIGRPIAVAFFLVVLLLTAQHLPLIENYVEYRDALQQTETLALQFPANSVILYQVNDVYGELVAVPLRYMHGLNPIPFQQFDQNVMNAVSRWLADGFSVYLLHVPDNQTSKFGKYFIVDKITTVTLKYEVLTGQYGFFPSGAVTLKIDYPIVELKLP
jgi:arginyl-tRNA--protein-N-Asp/Glu arginylyltransferase